MRQLVRAALAVMFVVPVSVATPSATVLAATAVAGTVTDDLGAPVATAQIRFCQVNPAGTCTNYQADAAGAYSAATTPGDYTINFLAGSDLVSSERWENRVGFEPDDVVTVVADQVNIFDAALERRPLVSGTITDNTGQPVADVDVSICNSVTFSCALATSDAAGTYTTRADAQVSTISFRTSTHSAEYWDDQPTEALATPVDLTDHADRTLDPVLQLRTSFIDGTVTDDLGNLLEGIRVQACRVDINACEHVDTDAAGRYSLQLDAATYRLEVNRGGASQPHRREYFDDQIFFNDADPITLNENETFSADAELATRIAVSGTVTDDTGGGPLDGVNVQACGLVNTCRSDTTDAAGSYSINVFAGDSYTVEFDGSNIDYSSEFHDDANEAGAQLLAATPGAPVTGIDAGLSSAPNLTGTVTSTPAGAPVEGALVTACVNVINDCVGATTQPDGTYAIRAEPGTYHVFVDAGFLDLSSEYFGDTFDFNEAQLVTIVLGQPVADVDVELDPVGIIRGRVIDSSFAPIAGIEVSVCRLPNVLDCTTPVTDTDGMWATVANPGPNFVSFSDPGDFYAPVTWNPNENGAFNPVEVVSGGIVGNIDVLMSAPGTITGTVTDDGGNPIENAQVSVTGASSRFAFTDANGDYELTDLSVGTYVVSVSHPDHLRATLPDDVTVAEGLTTSGVDVQLALAGRISGTVTDPSGTPLAGATVRACSGPVVCVAFAQTGADGSYTLISVPSGEWFVQFEATGLGAAWFGPSFDIDEATGVGVVAGSTTTDVDMMFQQPGTISGSAQLAGGGALMSGSVTACRVDDAGCASTQTDDDGSYEFTTLLPGVYRVRFGGPDTHAPTFHGNTPLLAAATQLTVIGGQTVTDVNATLAFGGTISGAITDADGTGLFASQIDAMACSATADTCQSGFPSNGAYSIVGLPAADDYVVKFFDPFDGGPNTFQTEWYCDAESEAGAVRLTVTAGVDTTDIDASLRRTAEPDQDSCTVPTTDPDPDPDPDPEPDPDPDPEPTNFVTSLTPTRLADSRDEATEDGRFVNTGRRSANSTWEVEVAGRGGVSSNASAAVLNLTVLASSANGFATMFPCGDRPTASSANFVPGVVTANELVAQLSSTGSVCVYTSSDAHVIIDVVGELIETGYAPVGPARFADSRDQPTFDSELQNTGRREAGTTWEIPVAGRGEVPADATSVVANLTITRATGRGFATAFPCGEQPSTSSINFTPDRASANELVAKLSPAGSLCIFTSADAHVIVDVVGSLDDNVDFEPLAPQRFADSRPNPTLDAEFRNTGRRNAGTVWHIDIAGRGSVPADASVVVANVTITRATSRGFATMFPCGQQPLTSSVNFSEGSARPNEVITGLSSTGTVCISTSTTAHVIVDIVGTA